MSRNGRCSPWRGRALALALLTIGGLSPALAFLSAAPAAESGLRAAWRGWRFTSHRENPAAAAIPVANPGSTAASAPTGGARAALAGAITAALMGWAMRSRSQVFVSMQATRTEWFRRVRRIGGDQALFDVVIPKPMGVIIQKFPQRDGVGIFEIKPGGNADKINREVCIEEKPGMWVLEGDRIMAVNSVSCEKDDMAELGEKIKNGPDEVRLTLARNTRKSPIKVILMPKGMSKTVRRNARLSQALEWVANRECQYGCIDGWCGTCWHRDRTTNLIFKPCMDILNADWDSVLPLVLTFKPEKAGDATFLKPRGVV